MIIIYNNNNDNNNKNNNNKGLGRWGREKPNGTPRLFRPADLLTPWSRREHVHAPSRHQYSTGPQNREILFRELQLKALLVDCSFAQNLLNCELAVENDCHVNLKLQIIHHTLFLC